MDNEIEITTSDSKGIVSKIKEWSFENWQTILVILIVLIVGISAYNYNQEENNGKVDNSVAANNTNENNSEANNINSSLSTSDSEKETIAEQSDEKKAEIDDKKINEANNDSTAVTETSIGKVISSTNEDGKSYTVTAKFGEGITHLARYAFNEYLQENNSDVNLNQEQKIYIEDYMQNRKGNEKIEIGHQEVFSESLIKEAISQATNLSAASIQNLRKYVK